MNNGEILISSFFTKSYHQNCALFKSATQNNQERFVNNRPEIVRAMLAEKIIFHSFPKQVDFQVLRSPIYRDAN